MNDNAFDRIRQLCLALPETNERLSHGCPTFFIRDKKTFVTFVDDHHDDGQLAIWCHAPQGVQEGLVAQDRISFSCRPRSVPEDG